MEERFRDGEVGYGRPPKATRFKKGRSGNPGGRPKKKQTLAAILEQLLERKITIAVGGKPTRMPVMQGLLLQILNQSLKGDIRATRMVLDLGKAEGVFDEDKANIRLLELIQEKQNLDLLSDEELDQLIKLVEKSERPN